MTFAMASLIFVGIHSRWNEARIADSEGTCRMRLDVLVYICSMYSQSVVSLSVQILEIPSTRRRWSNNLTVTGKQFHSHLRTQSSLHQIESSRRSVTWHTRPHTALMNRRRNQFGRGNSDRSRSLFTRSTPLGITVSAPWLISCSNRCFPRYFCSRSILGLLNKAPLERRDREDEDENNCIDITYSLKVIWRAKRKTKNKARKLRTNDNLCTLLWWGNVVYSRHQLTDFLYLWVFFLIIRLVYNFILFT